MPTLEISSAETARQAKELYQQRIRAQVETPENIGKIVVIDVNTGDYRIDTLGIEASHELRRQNPNARLFGIRIGYNVAESLGGVLERTAS